MTRRNRMKKLAGYVKYQNERMVTYKDYPFIRQGDTVKLYYPSNNYRKHLQQLKALRGRR